MILYNTTFNIDASSEKRWVDWMLSEGKNILLSSSHVTDVKTYKLINTEEMGGVTYAVQAFIDTDSSLQSFLEQDEILFLNKVYLAFEGQLVHFCTQLRELR